MQPNIVRHRDLHRAVPSGFRFSCLALTGVCSARAKKDVIQFRNGDRITCEIIKLEKGYLYVKLDYADGTVAMDWSKIARVESAQNFVVADKAGKRYTGSLQNPAEGVTHEEPGELKVQVAGPSASQIIPANEVVEIDRTDTSFWPNLHGGMDAGLNFAKQQSRTQYNFQTNAFYQRTKWSAAANYESSFSGGGDITDLRNDLALNVTRQLLSPRNFYMGLADFLQSDEQQLDLARRLAARLDTCSVSRTTASSLPLAARIGTTSAILRRRPWTGQGTARKPS